ncbi:unnamed protein product, partial [Didymodactylos carnosus]
IDNEIQELYINEVSKTPTKNWFYQLDKWFDKKLLELQFLFQSITKLYEKKIYFQNNILILGPLLLEKREQQIIHDLIFKLRLIHNEEIIEFNRVFDEQNPNIDRSLYISTLVSIALQIFGIHDVIIKPVVRMIRNNEREFLRRKIIRQMDEQFNQLVENIKNTKNSVSFKQSEANAWLLKIEKIRFNRINEFENLSQGNYHKNLVKQEQDIIDLKYIISKLSCGSSYSNYFQQKLAIERKSIIKDLIVWKAPPVWKRQIQLSQMMAVVFHEIK